MGFRVEQKTLNCRVRLELLSAILRIDARARNPDLGEGASKNVDELTVLGEDDGGEDDEED